MLGRKALLRHHCFACFIKISIFSIVNAKDLIQIANQLDADIKMPNFLQNKAINFANYPESKWDMPIYFSLDNEYTSKERKKILNAILDIEKASCIKFEEILDPTTIQDKPRLKIKRNKDCSSFVGKTGGEQDVNLAQACLLYKGSILHELMHSLGFFHEQSRGDRDLYVRVNWSNVVEDKESMFTNYGDFIDTYNMEYDYGSVMHYGAADYSANGDFTIVTLDPKAQRTVGQRHGLSFMDKKYLNTAYCAEYCDLDSDSSVCLNNGIPDPKNCSMCICPVGFGGKLCDKIQKSASSNCGDLKLNLTNETQTLDIIGPDSSQLGMIERVQCVWRISAPNGSRIQIASVENLSIDSNSEFDTCENFLEIKGLESENKIIHASDDDEEVKEILDWSKTGFYFCKGKFKAKSIDNQLMVILHADKSDPLGIQGYKAPKLKLRIARENDNKLGLGSVLILALLVIKQFLL